MTLFLALLFGLLQGLRHAVEPDHVVAVSTMISDKETLRARMGYAVAWGVGHAAMLVAVGGCLLLLRAEMPDRVGAAFEIAVSFVLMGLGLRAVLFSVRGLRAVGHAHAASAVPRGWRSIGPLAIGMVHGLAGSGALTALVVARLPSPAMGLAFMGVFGAGATLGMAALAGAAGVPITRVLRLRWGAPALLGATGTLSLVLGVLWLAPALARLRA